jgi:hypothetical protein
MTLAGLTGITIRASLMAKNSRYKKPVDDNYLIVKTNPRPNWMTDASLLPKKPPKHEPRNDKSRARN